jgi:FkbM family methyltransferase
LRRPGSSLLPRPSVRTRLHEHVTAAAIPVAHACEVGVYRPEFANVADWIEAGTRATLVECDPVTARALRDRWGARATVRIHECAVADAAGPLLLHRAGASTFGENVPRSPAVANDGFVVGRGETFLVAAVTFDTLDDGTIDLLAIDIEGGEWFVLRHLRSRPAVISVETHGKRYRNPFRAEIEGWMRAEGYGAWYHDDTDTVYRRGWQAPVEDRSRPKSWFRRLKARLRGY